MPPTIAKPHVAHEKPHLAQPTTVRLAAIVCGAGPRAHTASFSAMPVLDAERAPLLPPATTDGARSGGDGMRGEGEAPAGESRRVADVLLAGASRVARELRDCIGLLLIALALAASAAVAPARVVRAFTARTAFDVTARGSARSSPAETAAARELLVPMPPGHARGVSLWATAGDGARIHARVFPPAGAAAAKEPSLRDGDVSSSFLEALRHAARAGDVAALLPPPGGAVETWAWSGTVEALNAAGMTVICIDLRGQGRSFAPTTRYSIHMLAADAAALVVRACGGAAVHVVGWSLGAGVGLQMALDRPELARSICMFGFTAAFSGGEPTACARAAKAIVASPRVVAALGVGGHGMLLAAMLAFRAGGPRERVAARRAIHAANSLAGYIGTVSAWQPFDVTARLGAGELRCPLLHLHTALDGQPGGHTAANKARDVALVIAGGGRATMRTQAGPWSHAWPMEDPPSFNAALLRWLRGAGTQ